MAMGPMRRISSRVRTTKKMVTDIWKLIEALPCSLTKSGPPCSSSRRSRAR